MFWRFITSRWVALLGLLLALVGIPGVIQDAQVWFGWFGKLPRTPSLSIGGIGCLLIGMYVIANRNAVYSSCARLLLGADAALAAFRREMQGRPRKASWADLDSGGSFESCRWEVIDHTVRRTGLVAGEGYPALVGMAKVKEMHGQRHLYMNMFVHKDGSHMELWIESHHDPIIRRHAVVKVAGEVLSDTTFAPCLTPAVADMRRRGSLREETAHLLDVSDILTVSVRDTFSSTDGERERVHDLLQVPLAGYKAVNQRLSGIASGVWSASVLNYSPPEFGPKVHPRLIDQHMRSITDLASYDQWRKSMSEVFGAESRDPTGTE